MKPIRLLVSLLAIAMPVMAFAADPAGTWKWSTTSPTGDIPTTLKLEVKHGKVTGAYSNQFGDTPISNATLRDDTITFEIIRNLGGQKYVVKYHGRIEGDSIHGTIEAPGHDGGEAVKLEWNAKRTTQNGTDAKPKG